MLLTRTFENISFKGEKLSFLLTLCTPRLFVLSFIEELRICWPVVVKAPSNEKSQMSAILTVFILLTTENKFCMCLDYFSSLKGNKLWALHAHEFWSLRFALITFNLRKLLWIPGKGSCVIERAYRLEWQYWKVVHSYCS